MRSVPVFNDDTDPNTGAGAAGIAATEIDNQQ
jgi:hypothetical protein